MKILKEQNETLKNKIGQGTKQIPVFINNGLWEKYLFLKYRHFVKKFILQGECTPSGKRIFAGIGESISDT